MTEVQYICQSPGKMTAISDMNQLLTMCEVLNIYSTNDPDPHLSESMGPWDPLGQAPKPKLLFEGMLIYTDQSPVLMCWLISEHFSKVIYI